MKQYKKPFTVLALLVAAIIGIGMFTGAVTFAAAQKVAATIVTGLAMGAFIYDLKNELSYTSVSNIAAKTSSFNSSGVDLVGQIGKVVIVQNVGTVSGTTPTLDGKIQDSDDNSTFADVSGYTFTQVTASNSLQTLAVDTRLVRRYIRYVGTIGGTTPSFTMGVELIGQLQTK